jgi:hypothetical protein
LCAPLHLARVKVLVRKALAVDEDAAEVVREAGAPIKIIAGNRAYRTPWKHDFLLDIVV